MDIDMDMDELLGEREMSPMMSVEKYDKGHRFRMRKLLFQYREVARRVKFEG
jgi:hypothetical protein